MKSKVTEGVGDRTVMSQWEYMAPRRSFMSNPVDVAKRWAADNLLLTDLTVAVQEKHSTWTVLTFECPGVDPADMPFFVVTDDGDVHLESVPFGHWFDD